MRLVSLVLPLLLPMSAVFSTPAVSVFKVADAAGKSLGTVSVESVGGKARLEAFGRVFVFDGKQWLSNAPVDEKSLPAVGLMAAIVPAGTVTDDATGRPVLLTGYRAGKLTARIDYRYDADGLWSANVVFSDGSGYEFRRVSLAPAAGAPSDFEAPAPVPPHGAPAPAAPERPPDATALGRLLGLGVSRRDLEEFDREGGLNEPKSEMAPPESRAPAPRTGTQDAQENLAADLFGRDPLVHDERLLRYVNLVGATMAATAVPGSDFHFGVTQSDVPYATAFPGDIVVISRGELFLMGSEAELAVALGREVCRRTPRIVPAGGAAAIAQKESRLDACGAHLAFAAGYDAAPYFHVLEQLQERAQSARARADLQYRLSHYREFPEYARGGRKLAERFKTSTIM